MDGTLFHKCRNAAGLTAEEAGQLVHVTGKTILNWESGTHPIPLARLELFFTKIIQAAADKGFDVFVIKDGQGHPIDLIAFDLYYDHHIELDNGVVRTLTIVRGTNRPYLHTTEFRVKDNFNIIPLLAGWVLHSTNADPLELQPSIE